jgi:hypothetical protein
MTTFAAVGRIPEGLAQRNVETPGTGFQPVISLPKEEKIKEGSNFYAGCSRVAIT